MKIMLIVSCSEWLTCLFLFIMVEFEKLLYSPDLKMVHIFLVMKVFQKDTMFKNEFMLNSLEQALALPGTNPCVENLL